MNYSEAGEILLAELEAAGGSVKKWRAEMSGKAWYHDKTIVAPMPKTAKSFEVFAHEVGHILIYEQQTKKRVYTQDLPSWRRELDASEFSMEQFKRFNLKLPREVKSKIYWYVTYSVCQALNRGMKKIPAEAKKYTEGRITKVPKYSQYIKQELPGGAWTYEKKIIGYRYYAK